MPEYWDRLQSVSRGMQPAPAGTREEMFEGILSALRGAGDIAGAAGREVGAITELAGTSRRPRRPPMALRNISPDVGGPGYPSPLTPTEEAAVFGEMAGAVAGPVIGGLAGKVAPYAKRLSAALGEPFGTAAGPTHRAAARDVYEQTKAAMQAPGPSKEYGPPAAVDYPEPGYGSPAYDIQPGLAHTPGGPLRPVTAATESFLDAVKQKGFSPHESRAAMDTWEGVTRAHGPLRELTPEEALAFTSDFDEALVERLRPEAHAAAARLNPDGDVFFYLEPEAAERYLAAEASEYARRIAEDVAENPRGAFPDLLDEVDGARREHSLRERFNAGGRAVLARLDAAEKGMSAAGEAYARRIADLAYPSLDRQVDDIFGSAQAHFRLDKTIDEVETTWDQAQGAVFELRRTGDEMERSLVGELNELADHPGMSEEVWQQTARTFSQTQGVFSAARDEAISTLTARLKSARVKSRQRALEMEVVHGDARGGARAAYEARKAELSPGEAVEAGIVQGRGEALAYIDHPGFKSRLVSRLKEMGMGAADASAAFDRARRRVETTPAYAESPERFVSGEGLVGARYQPMRDLEDVAERLGYFHHRALPEHATSARTGYVEVSEATDDPAYASFHEFMHAAQDDASLVDFMEEADAFDFVSTPHARGGPRFATETTLALARAFGDLLVDAVGAVPRRKKLTGSSVHEISEEQAGKITSGVLEEIGRIPGYPKGAEPPLRQLEYIGSPSEAHVAMIQMRRDMLTKGLIGDQYEVVDDKMVRDYLDQHFDFLPDEVKNIRPFLTSKNLATFTRAFNKVPAVVAAWSAGKLNTNAPSESPRR